MLQSLSSQKLKLVILMTVISYSVMDSSCGNKTWMPLFLSSRSEVNFTAFDMVKQNIRNHKKRFRDTDWKFEVHDIVTDEIKNSYDLIISRHTTQHLVLSDVVKVIRNFVDSSSKFLLTTSFPYTKVRFRPSIKVNLSLSISV